MISRPDFKGARVYLSPEERIAQLEEIIQGQQEQIDLIKEHVGWNDDPAVRRAQRSNLTQIVGSVGWWSGALGTSESLKLGAALYLTGNEAMAFGLAAWMIGCSVAAGPTEKIAKAIVVRFTKAQYQTHPTDSHL